MKLKAEESAPLYLRIIDLMKRRILAGKYRAGDKLPSVRELAVELQVNPNTVARAYAVLQEEGVSEARPGGGNYVAQSPEEARRASRRLVEGEIAAAVDGARRLGFGAAEIRAVFERYLDQYTEGRDE